MAGDEKERKTPVDKDEDADDDDGDEDTASKVVLVEPTPAALTEVIAAFSKRGVTVIGGARSGALLAL